MLLSVIGLNHKTAPVEIREQVAFAESELPQAVTALRKIPGIEECVLLSTCNRTEAYICTAGDAPAEAVAAVLGAPRGVEPAVLLSSLYVHRGADAARHALAVAAGLDSLVVGESQILGQVRRAFEIARAVRGTGPVLNRLMQAAVSTGRRVRQEVGLSRGNPSIPRAALALCRTVLGPLAGRRVVVVGAGKIAGMAVEAFAGAGAHIAAVANRTPQAARSLAAAAGAEAISLDALTAASRRADVLVVCVGASAPVVSTEMLVGAGPRPSTLLVVDLGIPRGVAPAVASLPGVCLYGLDDLPLYGAIAPVPPEQLARAQAIIDEAADRYAQWMASRAAVPLIEALYARAQAVVDGEIARARLHGLDAAHREAVRAAVDAAVRKVLHGPVVRLREYATREDAQALDLARALFDLDGETAGRPEVAEAGSQQEEVGAP